MVTAVWESLRSRADAWHCVPCELCPKTFDEYCRSWLSAEERRQGEERRTDRLRHDYLAARLLCRVVLSSYTGVDPRSWSFRAGPFGKPNISEPREFRSLRFSLTRTRGLAVCLVSAAGEVGVDAEETSQPVDVCRIARHFFSVAERVRLSHLPAQRRRARFFEQWVAKEAYLKGTGRGLAYSPERLTIEFGENGRPIAIGDWRIGLHRPTPNHVAATAVRPRRAMATVPILWMPAASLFERRIAIEG